MALLLAALGHSNRKIAECLGCSVSTVGQRLGPFATRAELSSAQFRDLFEQYDAQRNIEEVIMALSGSPQQARLRTSLRARAQQAQNASSDGPNIQQEELSDAQLRCEVESLVGQTLNLSDAD